MLDINLFRNDSEFKRILESEKNRGKSLDNAKNTKKFDDLWKEAKQKKEELRQEKNKISKEILHIKQIDFVKAKEKSKKLDNDIKDLEKKEAEYLLKRDEARYQVGNILWKDVPIGQGEEQSKSESFWGYAKVQKQHLAQFKKDSLGKMKFEELNFVPKGHVDFGIEKDLFDLERAAKVSGARFYYLKNKFAILHLSILRFAIDKLMQKGYAFMYTPFIINKDVIEKAAELADFEEMLYKVGDDQFLIATAEQTLASFHMDEVLPKESLPLKYVGLSSCFRKEAGSHTKDTRGIFRVHQFDKVEQYVFCKPEDSDKILKEIMKNEEEVIQALELPYRIVNICSGDLNLTAAKKYDIEAWMPVQGQFRELGSGSITTDFQTRKLNVRFEDKGERFVCHSLNCTVLASPRILTAIIENHQTKDNKIKIPKALWNYTGFKEI